ncbi:hypothetical protein [Planctomicrobium piriforme]|uniref:Uncharacterized protein n=1 Tax=Planctomicrobium piriforme TaxID=1576369 RepID=A0A1I3IP51_9PLAN|nr:hypothetical protein [Planctomicrobium piriforme]SFI49758.1 hypothetical protein SAMN05421753_109202 [Planctomicrobium piriforme]
MNILLYKNVPCRSCDELHQLYLCLEEVDRPDVHSVRFQCPKTGAVVGERVKGSAERPHGVQPDWIECAPVYTPHHH